MAFTRVRSEHNGYHYPNPRPPSTQAPSQARPVHPPVRQAGRPIGRRRPRSLSARKRTDYILTEFRADFGRGFLVEKISFDAPAAYHVNIDDERRSCECPGYVQHGHCKHSDGLAALIAAGRL